MGYAWRFFSVVPPVPPLLQAAIAVSAMVSGLVIAFDRSRAAAALTPILLLQLFASSSGFLIPARRGYYDLVLVSGEGRLRIAAVHWLTSVLPGVLGWCLLASIEAARAGGRPGALLTSGSVAAVLLVSTIPWAAGIAMPRFGLALCWLLALTGLSMTAPDTLAGEFSGVSTWVERALWLLLYPPLLVGKSLATDAGSAGLPALVAAAGAVAGAFVRIDNTDVSLDQRR